MAHFSIVGTVFARLSHTSPTNGATFVSRDCGGYTLAFANRIAHSGSQGETRGVLDGGAITTLGAFCAVRKPCVAGCQNGILCRFWALAGGAPEERREPAGQRCAYARRCLEAPRARRHAQPRCYTSLRTDGSRGSFRSQQQNAEKHICCFTRGSAPCVLPRAAVPLLCPQHPSAADKTGRWKTGSAGSCRADFRFACARPS